MPKVKTRRRHRLYDKQGGRCLRCRVRCVLSIEDGKTHMPNLFTVDHVIPVSKGGRKGPSNWQGLCYSCNRKKGLDTTDYRKPAAASELNIALRVSVASLIISLICLAGVLLW